MGKKSKRSKPQTAATPTTFKIYPAAGPAQPGIVVVIDGLTKQPELNGQIVLCLEHVPTDDRPTQHKVKLINVDKKAPLAIKAENLQPADDLVSVICSSTIGEVEHCQDFSDSVVHLVGDMMPKKWGTGETPKWVQLSLKEGRSIYQISVPAARHSFILEVVACRDGTVYSRLLQAFKNFFTAKEWSYKMKWMNLNETKIFLQDLALLKKKIDSFVVEEITEALIIPPGQNPVEFTKQITKESMCECPDRKHLYV